MLGSVSTIMSEDYGERRRALCSLKNKLVKKAGVEKPVLSVVLPAHNEATTIKCVVTDYFYEIATKLPTTLIVAEDGSIDQTPEILASLANEIPILLLSFPKRKGFAKGVGDALRKCKEEWIFFSDSDGQYCPSDFWRLWESRKGCDMIIGRKTHRGDGIFRIILSLVFHSLVRRLFGLSSKDCDCGFRLMKKSVVDSVVDETRVLKYSFWTEFTVRASLKGFRIKEVPIKHVGRKKGGSRIYKLSTIPFIFISQLRGLARLYATSRRS